MKTTKKKLLEEREELLSDIQSLLKPEWTEDKLQVTLKWLFRKQIDTALLGGYQNKTL